MDRKEQIKKAEEIIAYGCSDELRNALIKDFPELVESKDERIRKKIVAFIKSHVDEFDLSTDCWDMLVYLEKHKESNPAEWSEDDKRALNNTIVALSMYAHGEIPYILPSQLLKDVERLKSLYPVKQEWNKEDEENSAFVVASLDAYSRIREEMGNKNGQDSFVKAVDWFKNRFKSLRIQQHAENFAELYLPRAGTDIEDAILQSIAKAKVQGNIVLRFNGWFHLIKHDSDVETILNSYSRYCKSCWKPTEEQMKVLSEAVDEFGYYTHDILKSLYNDLNERL